jgi:protein-disulfide isomerase
MFRSLTALLFTILLAATPAFAADKAAFTDAQKTAMDAEIKQYILDNPQLLISSVEAYYNKQKQTQQDQEGPLKTFPAGLLDFPGTPSVGPKDAKVSVVEFFDYNCGYCKQVANDVERLIDENKSVRVIFKDLPILADSSEVAARYALAANKQGKYLQYHMALLQHQGAISETMLLDTAKTVGLNTDQLKKDANTQDVRDMLNKNLDLARTLGVRGTPFFVIGRQKVPGAIGYTRMKEIIKQEGGSVSDSSSSSAVVPDVSKIPDVKTDDIKPSASAATPDTSTSSDETPPVTNPISSDADAETQQELEKARADARAMIQQIKDEAAAMQKTTQEAQAAADKAKAAADAQAAAAKK